MDNKKPKICVQLRHKVFYRVLLFSFLSACLGCWAPMQSRGIPASQLPDEFRIPYRTAGRPFNFSNLTIHPPSDYLLGPGDMLSVTVPSLYDRAETTPLHVRVMASGDIHLPLVGAVGVEGMNLLQAQRAITESFANGFFRNPSVNVVLAEKSTVSVLVLGNVKVPGVYVLSKYENDVGHALAAAQGLAEDAADIIEVHRRADGLEFQKPDVTRLPRWPAVQEYPHTFSSQRPFDPQEPFGFMTCDANVSPNILHIALRGPRMNAIHQNDVLLQSGDVVVVPGRRHEVFYVVGRLSQTNTVRFTIGDRERELGVGFVLPRDREIDVVTAVAMAGYIDPIDSPTTVTVHRVLPDGRPFLINVDLIAARYDRKETILVTPGDIIYLNPDTSWWLRRTFDRVIADLITIPYAKTVGR